MKSRIWVTTGVMGAVIGLGFGGCSPSVTVSRDEMAGEGGTGGSGVAGTGGSTSGAPAEQGGTDTGGGGNLAAGGTSGSVGASCTTMGAGGLLLPRCPSTLGCTLGACRTDCRTDADCPRGSLCSGSMPPYGCSLPAEDSCKSSSDCPSPLVCAPDSKCRLGCEVSDDCPRNDHDCRTGVCVSRADSDPRWFDCDDGETVCANYLTGESCVDFPESCYQRMGCRLDGMNWGLIETCSPGFCFYSVGADPRSASCS
jgi:hypothetical protein